jgi:hypothetical protein
MGLTRESIRSSKEAETLTIKSSWTPHNLSMLDVIHGIQILLAIHCKDYLPLQKSSQGKNRSLAAPAAPAAVSAVVISNSLGQMT